MNKAEELTRFVESLSSDHFDVSVIREAVDKVKGYGQNLDPDILSTIKVNLTNLSDLLATIDDPAIRSMVEAEASRIVGGSLTWTRFGDLQLPRLVEVVAEVISKASIDGSASAEIKTAAVALAVEITGAIDISTWHRGTPHRLSSTDYLIRLIDQSRDLVEVLRAFELIKIACDDWNNLFVITEDIKVLQILRQYGDGVPLEWMPAGELVEK